jgi:hypothetical protein
MKKSPHERHCGGHMLWRDSLDFLVSANRAVRAQRFTERHKSRVESRMTIIAAPRINSEDAQHEIGGELATRPSRVFTLADGAGHRSLEFVSKVVDRIGHRRKLRKRFERTGSQNA